MWGALLRAFGHALMTDAGIRSKVIMGNFFTRIRERSFALALTVAAVLTFGALSAAPATAVEPSWPTASISGTVVGAGGVSASLPVGSFVKAYTLTEGGSYVLDAWGAQISTSGTFTIVNLPAGTYKLGVNNNDASSLWGSLPMNESDGVGELTSVVVNADQAVMGQVLTLPLLLTISGTVSGDQGTDDSADDIPLAGATILAYAAADLNGAFSASAVTDADGKYTLQGLEYGSYAVSFQHHHSSASFEYATEYWDNKPTMATSNRVTVAAGAVNANIDATLSALTQVTSGVPTIVGTASLGQVLTAEPGVWVPSDLEFNYSWQRDGEFFLDGWGKNYTVTAEDVGHVLSVSVNGSKLGYRQEHVSSLPTAVVTDNTVTTPTTAPTPTPSATPTPTPAPIAETGSLAETGDSTPASVVGAKSDRVTTPAATLVVGASIPVTGEGFAPFEVVDIWLHSTPVLLGTLTADAQGRISGNFAMPTGVATGTHHRVLVDEAGVSST